MAITTSRFILRVDVPAGAAPDVQALLLKVTKALGPTSPMLNRSDFEPADGYLRRVNRTKLA